MKMKIQYLMLLLVCVNMSAQKSSIKKANQYYDKQAYIDVIQTYERLYDNGYKSPEMFQKLGNSYYFNSKFDKAAKWYGELFAMTQDFPAEYYYRYAQSMKSLQDYAKADELMTQFNQKNGTDRRAQLAAEQKNYLYEIKRNSGRYNISDSGINSENSDYGSIVLGDKIVFASARAGKGVSNKKNSWTGERFTNLYAATQNADGSLSDPVMLSDKINSIYHESTPVFTKDGNTIYFTRNNFLRKKGKNKDGAVLLKIYKASLVNGKWDNVVEMPFNSSDYSVAHPALSPDEKYLYFASNMPGTLGQADIFRVKIKEDGTYGTPENLGNMINTEGRETFPYFTEDGQLYFASDGHPGLGGLDVFIAKAENEKWKYVTNAGEPVNSSSDDFCLFLNTETKMGYVSSNRAGGQGGDDIYNIKELKPILYPCEQFLAGEVIDKDASLKLVGAKVTLLDHSFKILKSAETDVNGKFDFGKADCNSKFFIRAEKPEYETVEVVAETPDTTGSTFVKVETEKLVKQLSTGDDIAKAFGIREIYFDLDKADIRKDAVLQLVKILDVMKQNPEIKVDIRSHTDSRQTKEYNLKLSDRRAKATKDWLIKNGIEKSRLTAKGYGESQLVNKCADGVECTEAEHQANRRSEFILVK